MYKDFLEILEFNKIILNVANFCKTFVGKCLANDLVPSNNKNIVTKLLRETSEAVNLIARNSTPSFCEISDISIYLKLLESDGILSAKALLDLATIFRLSAELKDYFSKDYLDNVEFPILSDLFASLYTNKGIVDSIFSSIIDENTIDSSASSELRTIRRKQLKLEQDIRSKLNDLIHSSSYSKYIQESLVTSRNNRFVIPVKEEYRSQIKGFIHDVSNAGSTVFIEPLSVFEMNNELNQLKVAEELEIERILRSLSKLFLPYLSELQLDFEIVGKLDFIFAKALYSKNINGITPIIFDEKKIYLKNARHPLIDNNKVVPISLEVGNSFSSLLITGPNTGGKTVTLKTVGLLTCMACSGLNIPADENSGIHVFDHIFTDIGDNQSIADSLSTFSSHIVNIISILEKANSNSLILVDELGSGTDPLEGANLAISILEYIQNLGALTIVTTHYPELKKYALVTDGFENASVEFDIDTLSPTYKLLVGIPGKSNAFEISKKLGLDNFIIQKAKARMSSSDINIEELLKSIYDNKSKIEEEKEQIHKELEQVSLLKQNLERDNSSLNAQEKEIIQKAKIEARNILLEAKSDADRIIREMNNISNSKDLENSRNELNLKLKNIKILEDTQKTNHSYLSEDDIKIGLNVFVSTLNKEGVVVSNISKSKEVQVQIGSLKMNIPIRNLQKAKNSSSSTPKNSTYTTISKSMHVSTEINIIGLNVLEAIPLVDKFLDDASLAKLKTVRIVHGKGTGKLRDGVHQFLKKHPHVSSFRLGSFGEGEMGVTVVELK